jgi:hypothetical protein
MPTRESRARSLGVPVADLPDGRGRHGNHVRGGAHPRWNHGRMLSEHGYVKVRLGPFHPLSDPNGYAYEHTLVAVTALGRLLRIDELVRQPERRQDRQPLGEPRSQEPFHSPHPQARSARGRRVSVTPSDRRRSPRPRLYATRRDHLRALWVERLRTAAEDGASESGHAVGGGAPCVPLLRPLCRSEEATDRRGLDG